MALPIELDTDSNISLLRDFIQKNFVDLGMCADFAIHDTDGHNPHAHILLTVRPLNENGTWQYKTKKEYLCIKDGKEKGFTAAEFKEAQKEGWEKQYRYQAGKKEIYLTPSAALEKDMSVWTSIRKAPDTAGKIPFPRGGTAKSKSVSGEKNGQRL